MRAEKKKLIEVALPLDAINREAAREKSIRHGHPSTLHLWWARRPLAACRAVLFAQLVDDPSAHPERFPTEEAQDAERQRLFDIIERLVPWEATGDEKVLKEARAEIRKCFPDGPPPILDPFAEGGSIPLEAQRLGLEAHASDLNPVAVLINKALIEIPPRWADRPPVHPTDGNLGTETWAGAQGLAEDVRYYGKWMRDEAERRIGHLYPKATLPDGSEANVIAWIWARTATCSNPACQATMPLVRSFWLGKKKGKEAWVNPVVERNGVHFEIGHAANGPPIEGTVTRTGAKCLVCNSHVPFDYVRSEGRAGRLGEQLMAVVAEGEQQRVYQSPTDKHETAADIARPLNVPESNLPERALSFRVQAYGMIHHADLFTNRQLVALTTFADLVGEAREHATAAARNAGLPALEATAYADVLATYLACAVSKIADRNSALVSWASGREHVRNTFGRQAIPMVWDFTEINPAGSASGSFLGGVGSIVELLRRLPMSVEGSADQNDAQQFVSPGYGVYCTDPPYYDNIGYADLSDYFYVWMRRSLRTIYPELFGTLLTPKAEELVATPYRFDNDKEKAREFFEQGFVNALANARTTHSTDAPMTLFYAFKQAEESSEGDTASTGWETLLGGLIRAGWSVSGTWPMHTELRRRMLASGTNALASSIILACRPRPQSAGVTDRRGFLAALRAELPVALRNLQHGSIAPVDLAQAAIGPGMSVFTRYVNVIEPDGNAMRVRAALSLINEVLAEMLDEQQGDFDPDTRWAIKWFDQYGMDEGLSGVAEQLCTSYNVSLRGLESGGLVSLAKGKTRLLERSELPNDWDPTLDDDVSVWEVTQHLAKRLDEHGEGAAAALLARLNGTGDAARDLAYLLFALCERRKRAKEALAYNALVVSWPEIARKAAESIGGRATQGAML